jgi:hypothetical protein
MEKLSSNQPERQPQPRPELEQLAAERLRGLERGNEHQTGRRHEALESAREKLKQVEQVRPAVEAAPIAEPVTQRLLTKAENYRQTMLTLRHRMKPAARSFSKLIHAPVIESASEVVGKTVLRPSVSLGATSTAVVLTGFIYLYARYYGFELRGSEIWLTLIVGAILGLVGEGAYKALRRLSGRR